MNLLGAKTRRRLIQTSSISSRETRYQICQYRRSVGSTSLEFNKIKREDQKQLEQTRRNIYNQKIKKIIQSCDFDKSTNESKQHTMTTSNSARQLKQCSFDLNIEKLSYSQNNSQIIDIMEKFEKQNNTSILNQSVDQTEEKDIVIQKQQSIDFQVVDTFNALLIKKMNEKEQDISHEQEVRSRSLMQHLTQSTQMKTKPLQFIHINPSIFQSSFITERKSKKQSFLNDESRTKIKTNNQKNFFNFNEQKRQTLKWEAEPTIYFNYFRKLKDTIYQRKIHRSSKKIDQNYSQLEQFLLKQYLSILQAFHIRNNHEVISIFGTILEICQDIQASDYFTRFIIILGEYFNDAHDLNKAIFFLRQAHICATLLHQYREKIIILMLLAKISSRLKIQEASIRFLKKALEYTWLMENRDLELKVYDQLGLSFFYLGFAEKAAFFHNKFTYGITEPLTTITRMNSKILLKRFQEEKQPFLNGLVLHRLTLPIINKFELIDGKHPYCDQFKTINYQRTNAKTTINFLLQEQEFQAYDIDISILEKPIDYFESRHYQYFKFIDKGQASTFEELDKKIPLFEKKNPNLFLYHGNAPHTWVPQEIIAIKQKYLSLQRKYNEGDDNKNHLKLSIQEKIFHRQQYNNQILQRQKKMISLDKVMINVNNRVYQNQSQLKVNDKWEQVYIKHLNNPDNYNLSEKVYLQKYRQIIEGIILEF